MQCEAQRAEDDSTFARCCSTHIFFCFSFELVSCCFTDSLLVVCFRQPNFIWTNRLNLPRLSSAAHQNSDSDTEIETFKKKKRKAGLLLCLPPSRKHSAVKTCSSVSFSSRRKTQTSSEPESGLCRFWSLTSSCWTRLWLVIAAQERAESIQIRCC